jgi:hypothetical protein
MEDMFFRDISKRYGHIDRIALKSILCPILIPLHTLDKNIVKLPQQSHFKASFSILIDNNNRQLMQPGRTGKFVPASYFNGGPWKEIAKGRILVVNHLQGIAYGEVYVGGPKQDLIMALEQLSSDDYLEIDQYGASAKVLSGLVEYTLARKASEQGYTVRRMPEDVAKHVNSYYYYDFEFVKDNIVRRVEVKSLWGTDTKYARLIHSRSKGHETSSCKFSSQDIFAVSLFLRTGNINDFAFARSVSRREKPYGLPPSSKSPEYVNQNPPCRIGDGTWFATIDEVWSLE